MPLTEYREVRELAYQSGVSVSLTIRELVERFIEANEGADRIQFSSRQSSFNPKATRGMSFGETHHTTMIMKIETYEQLEAWATKYSLPVSALIREAIRRGVVECREKGLVLHQR